MHVYSIVRSFKIKIAFVDWYDLCLSQKESLRLHLPVVWLKSSLGRNETGGVHVLVAEKLLS